MTLRWMCGLMLALTQLTSAQPAPGQAPAVPPSSQITGYSAANSPRRERLGEEIPGWHFAGEHSRKHAAPERAPPSCGIALRQRQCRMDSRPSSKNGDSTPRSRPSTFCFPPPKVRVVEMLEPTKFKAKLQEPVVAGRSHQRPDRGATPHLQRLFGRRRRNRSAGICELRQSRRLRATRSPGNFGQGRDRDRALRDGLARHQAQSCRRARGGRVHHLFGSRKATAFSTAMIIRRAAGGRAKACNAAA